MAAGRIAMYGDIHPIDIHAGKRLREARKALGFSQDTLASALENPVTPQQIQKRQDVISINTFRGGGVNL